MQTWEKIELVLLKVELVVEEGIDVIVLKSVPIVEANVGSSELDEVLDTMD